MEGLAAGGGRMATVAGGYASRFDSMTVCSAARVSGSEASTGLPPVSRASPFSPLSKQPATADPEKEFNVWHRGTGIDFYFFSPRKLIL